MYVTILKVTANHDIKDHVFLRRKVRRQSNYWIQNLFENHKSYSEGQLEIFPTPDVHPGVIGPQIFKIFPIYAEQSTSHSWTPSKI